MNPYEAPWTPVHHSIWTRVAMTNIQLAKTTEYGLTFGVAYFGEVWFRFVGDCLFCHLAETSSATAIMERRNS